MRVSLHFIWPCELSIWESQNDEEDLYTNEVGFPLD